MSLAPQSGDVSRRDLVVGIGASAGGLAAFTTFLTNTPADTGMAFILVQHLDPHHKSLLVELLGARSPVPVVTAEDGVALRKNCVFVIPPDATLTMKDGILRVVTPAPPREQRRPIDTFFAALADDCGDRAVAIVLSGVGSDGAQGVRMIKEHGGLTLAQAEFDHVAQGGMPQSAADTGMVDYVALVEDMPGLLIDYQQHLGVEKRKDGNGTRTDVRQHLAAIAGLLRAGIDHDFSGYKENTLIRRIQRRMHVLHIDDVPSYVERLKADRGELEALFHELLIGVTQFFRDPDAFEALKSTALAALVSSKAAGEPIRIWVPGCSTGEEVYSIAILLHECMADGQRPLNSVVNIFGTDIDDNAVAIARAGRYRQPVAGVSPERLERWFVKDGDHFRLRREIRELCAFSVHSIVKDPPFSRLDLISCRNVLIYLDTDLQDQVMQTFHYALKPGGFLFLGTSEGITRGAKYFEPVDEKHRIFGRRDTGELLLPLLRPSTAALPPMPLRRPTRVDEGGIDKSVRRVMEHYAPAYFVIDRQHEILRFSGSEARHYLEPSPGAANLNLFSLLQKTLKPAVRVAVEQCFATERAVINENLTTEIDGKSRSLTLIVEPVLSDAAKNHGLCVVAFRDASKLADQAQLGSNDANTLALEKGLRATKAQLQAATDQLEAYIEDMQSTTEEYQAVTEELQSSNEELETAKEELQSVNEELQTINGELQSKNDATERLNSDLKNLLDSTQIATVFLDDKLRIKHYTPMMEQLFSLREGDRGRPITDFVSQLAYDDLRNDVQKVERTLTIVERELDLKDGAASFVMRIRPYRTIQNVIEGVVITFSDLTANKQAQRTKELLIDELQHRTRNLLAVVQAISNATLAAAGSLDDYAAEFSNRIQALSRVQGLLTRREDATVMLSEIVQAELAGVGVTPDRERIIVDGPPVLLPYQTTQLLALALHELATNALKYGALKGARGRLNVTWQVLDQTGKPHLELTWVESDVELGEQKTVSLRHGFGRELLEKAIPYQLGATTRFELLKDGMRWWLGMPLQDGERRESHSGHPVPPLSRPTE